MENWPTTLQINAWLGDRAATSDLASSAKKLASDTKRRPRGSAGVLGVEDVSPSDWRNSQIGWGLILRDSAAIPEPLQELLKTRPGSPVLRYMPGILTHLRNPAANVDIPIINGPTGIEEQSSLPHYLLIYGSPADVPWELQHVLNKSFYVGRLDLAGEALENYVAALINEWGDSTADIQQAVAWSTVQDSDGITTLMRTAIADQVVQEWRKDSNKTFHDNIVFLDGAKAPASGAGLVDTLQSRRPALIVTTSHGKTGPLSKPQEMKEQLGLLVDQAGKEVEPNALLATWQPDGAVWYAHACCSAGCSEQTQFDDQFSALIPLGSDVDQILKGVAGLGSLTARLPKALLGAKKPLRAFIGHVEPTFDLSLRDVGTGQHLTGMLRTVLYREIYTRKPVGLAFARWLSSGAVFSDPYSKALAAFNQNLPDARKVLLAYQLLSRDRSNTVILGDPTVALPKLP
jgi:hypothetical protein